MGGLSVCGARSMAVSLTTGTTADEQRLFASIGGECDTYSEVPVGISRKPRGEALVRVSVGVSTLEAEAIEQTSRASRHGERRPSSCNGCAYFVPAEVVLKELGFAAPMCSVKAELLPPARLADFAAGCPTAVAGPNKYNTDGVMLHKRYRSQASGAGFSAFAGKADPTERIDPRERTTDLPVLAEHKAAGIRAWHLVEDPEGLKPSIPLPIFAWEKLGLPCDPRDTYGDHKPELYVDHDGLLYSWAFLNCGGLYDDDRAGLFNETLTLVGPSGTGKTEAFAYFAYEMDLPLTRLSITPETNRDDFFGQMTLVGDQTQWEMGSFTHAYQLPGVFVLDEPNSASDAVWMLLRPALDSAGQLRIDNLNQSFKRHNYCFGGIAMNPAHDPIYRGVRDLSDPDWSRILVVNVDLPDLATEKSIIRLHCTDSGYDVSDEVIDKVMDCAERVRALITEGTLQASFGVRSTIKVTKLTWGFSILKAFRMALIDRLPTEQRDEVLMAIRSVVG